MNSNSHHSLVSTSLETTRPRSRKLAGPLTVDSSSQSVVRAQSLQTNGKRMVLAGFIITVLGVVLYCVACFAGGADADLGDVLFRNSVPLARATLGLLGLGTLVWLVGSVNYVRGAMNADDAASGDV